MSAQSSNANILQRKWGPLPVLALAGLAFLGSPSSFALSEQFCEDYAQQAVTQTHEYNALKCRNPGNSQWWDLRLDYHKGWCRLEPNGSALPREGLENREAIINACAVAIEAVPPGGDPSSAGGARLNPSNFKCPYQFGSRQFTDSQIRAYFNNPVRPSDGGSAVCDYYLPEGGSIRLQGSWVVSPVPWQVTVPIQLGCANRSGRPPDETGPTGRVRTSPGNHAVAHVTGDSGAAIDLARNHSLGPLNDMFIMAETLGKPCR